ncbi:MULTISPECIES: hypothetical protein [unclassified Haloarcula]|uniref:hypothetical protein n=1 Tax=unclassified Haloarcula TaxID=2624677 RepID=UPI0012ABC3D5|nr:MULTISPECIES: hypothetical protein [unclassified Haloarcula]
MAKRPQISDELHEFVHQIHEEYTGSSAGSFEQALNTVTQLAESEILDREGTEPGWYPGKYASEIVNRLSNMGSNPEKGSSGSAPQIGITGSEFQVNPDQQAVYKAVLGNDGEISIPEAERSALNLEQGQLMQVIAYSIEEE